MQEPEHQGGIQTPNPIPVKEKPAPPPYIPVRKQPEHFNDGTEETSED